MRELLSDRTGDSYDETPYPAYAILETHPGRLAAIARLHGVDAPDVRTARVLELGCATGGNLLPMAVGLPAARFLGIDLSPVQIATAERRARDAGLGNCTFRALDLRALPDDEGPFDYIVCHGVLSWVPADVRLAIFALCGRHLAKNGVAFVSYNVSPGFRLRSIARDILRFYAAGASGGALDRLEAARRGLLRVAAFDGEGPYHDAIRNEIENLERSDPTYIVHEHLADENHPLTFEELSRHADAQGLAWLSEAPLHRTWPPELSLPAVDEDDDRAVRRAQQEIDLHLGRPFRRSLLVRREASAHHRLDPDRAVDLWVRSSLSGDRGGEPFAGAPLLDEAWPRGMTVREIAAGEGNEDGGAALARTIVALVSQSRALELLAFQPPVAKAPPTRPHVPFDMRRALAEEGRADNFFHEQVQAADVFLRGLVGLCDGTRTETDLVEAARTLPACPPADALPVVVAGVLRFLLRAALLCEEPAPTEALRASVLRQAPRSGDEVVALGEAVGPLRCPQVRRARADQVAGPLQQMSAHGREPVVIA